MNGDTILYWMTHLAEGSWQAFKDAVERLAPDDDSEKRVTSIRYHLSDLAHVDFFINGARRWSVRPPALAGLAGREGAVLVGGRTPELVASLTSAAERFDCDVDIERHGERPSVIRLTGNREHFSEIAAAAGIRFSENYAYVLCSVVRPVPQNIDRLVLERAPTNWIVRSFDFESMSMIDGLHRNSACEYRPRHGLPRWYVHTKRQRLTPLPKREAIYAAAAIRGVSLLTYESDNQRLVAKRATLPPEVMVRIACLCSGRSPRVQGDSVYFDGVPQSIGRLLCAAAGQELPNAATQTTARSAL
jgi:hypothetical protein